MMFRGKRGLFGVPFFIPLAILFRSRIRKLWKYSKEKVSKFRDTLYYLAYKHFTDLDEEILRFLKPEQKKAIRNPKAKFSGRKKMGVLIVNPPSPNTSIIIRDLNRSGRTSRERLIWAQTSLASLAAMTPNHLNVKIIDCIAKEIDWKGFKKILQKEKPKYLVAHVITSVASNDFKTFELSKKVCNSVNISMGVHVSELVEESFRDCPSLDFIMVGEAENTFKELIEALECGGDLKKVDGLAYRVGGKVRVNKSRKFIKDLDELPMPRHDLLPIDKYVFPFISSKYTFVISSRGCPYMCTFCRQPIMWSRKVRSRSAGSIMKELRMLKDMDVNNFLFHSDTFTINKKIVVELCKKMVKEDLGLSWGCNSRVDTVDREMLWWMRRAGCWMIAYGIESGSEKVLKKCKKGATLKQAIQATEWTRRAGIKNYGYFIIGLPGETKQTIEETIQFAKRLPLTYAIFHTASPYPGTEFYKTAKKHGWLTAERWEEIDQGRGIPINYPQLSSKEIMEGIKRAYFSFYLRPKAIVNLVREIKNFSDLKHLFRMSVSHLRWQ